MKDIGDRIERWAKPIAKGMDTVLGTDITNCGGCQKMKENLNAGMSFADAIYDRLWPIKEDLTKSVDQENIKHMTQYIVSVNITEQRALDAEDLNSAEQMAFAGEGEILTRNKTVSARPRDMNQNVGGTGKRIATSQ